MTNNSRENLTFTNQSGHTLSAILEKPGSEVLGYVLYAHCFTCGKSIGTATQLSRGLVKRGFAVLRFDFTGLGSSEGDFSHTNFSSNIEDLVAAADYMRKHLQAPDILVGHSLGGAAAIIAANHIPEVRAVATIAAPSDPAHLTHLLRETVPTIRQQGWAHVTIGGQSFTLRQQFLDDISEHSLADALKSLNRPYLVLHSPDDELVEFEHARHLFDLASQPKQLVSLNGADHLLSKTRDAEHAAQVIADWSQQYLA